MKIDLLLIIALSMLATSCYMPLNGIVVDTETNQPIEGAVVLVEWTKTKGFGLTYTESYKVADALSDKDGKFELPGCYSPFVNDPNVTIYKKGYVAWSSRWLFPGMHNRTGFRWSNGVFRLDRFRDDYSYAAHVTFISLSIIESINSESKSIMQKAYDWETKMANKERN